MGKKLQQESAAGIPMEERNQQQHHHSAGCMWGIVHALQHQRWHHVGKKMITHRRRRGVGGPQNEINVDDIQEQSIAKMDIPSEGHSTGPSPITKSSVRSRIKAFISDEMSKRKGRHRRSRSYPARIQLTRTDSIHHLQPSDVDASNGASFDATPNFLHYENEDSSSSSLIVKQANKVEMKRDLFLKALRETKLSRGALISQIGYDKSMSFPLGSLSAKKRSHINNYMDFKGENSSQDVTKPEPSKNSSIELRYGVKIDAENKLPRKRFKNLKERIKQAMRESRKERHRITMDAVLHKVPYGSKFSEDKREEKSDFRIEKSISLRPMQRLSCFDESLDRYRQLYQSCFDKEAKHHVVERLKLRKDEGTQQKKSVGRIHSLPDLRLYYMLQSEEFLESTAKMPNKTDIDRDISSSNSGTGFGELMPERFPVDSENKILFDALVKGGNANRSSRNLGSSSAVLENEVGSTSFVDFKVESLEGLTPDDLEDLTTYTNNYQAEKSRFYESAEPDAVSALESSQEAASASTNLLSSEADPSIKPGDISVIEESSLHSIIPNNQRERNIEIPTTLTTNTINFEEKEFSCDDVAEFNFVKDVLELSGFSKNESLGAWHAPSQALDPLMFEDCYEDDQQGKHLSKLLLFDLVNEVLLEIYEKSFTYCPIQLCSVSYTRPVPMGYHVLEEVWAKIKWYLSWSPEADQLLDEAVSRDLAKSDEWMNLHFEAECVGLELEDMIFDDLLDELITT